MPRVHLWSRDVYSETFVLQDTLPTCCRAAAWDLDRLLVQEVYLPDMLGIFSPSCSPPFLTD